MIEAKHIKKLKLDVKDVRKTVKGLQGAQLKLSSVENRKKQLQRQKILLQQKLRQSQLEVQSLKNTLDETHQLNKGDFAAENDELKTKLENVTEDRDYLHTLLQDSPEVTLFDEDKGSYKPEAVQCMMNLTSYGVASRNC